VKKQPAILAKSPELDGAAGQLSTVNVWFVECPYCDGENPVSGNESAGHYLEAVDREIACKYCQCLFTLSESKQPIRRRSGSSLTLRSGVDAERQPLRNSGHLVQLKIRH